MSKINYAAVAKRLHTAVDKSLARDLKSWSKDPDMKKLFRGDAKDGHKVATLIHRGKVEDALEKMSDMDTSAREEVGTMIAKTSPAFYVEFLEPDGWVEVWHLNKDLKPAADDPKPGKKVKAVKKSTVTTDMAIVVSVDDYHELDYIASSMQGISKEVKSFEAGLGSDRMYWGVIYTGKQKSKVFTELCAASGYEEWDGES